MTLSPLNKNTPKTTTTYQYASNHHRVVVVPLQLKVSHRQFTSNNFIENLNGFRTYWYYRRPHSHKSWIRSASNRVVLPRRTTPIEFKSNSGYQLQPEGLTICISSAPRSVHLLIFKFQTHFYKSCSILTTPLILLRATRTYL